MYLKLFEISVQRIFKRLRHVRRKIDSGQCRVGNSTRGIRSLEARKTKKIVLKIRIMAINKTIDQLCMLFSIVINQYKTQQTAIYYNREPWMTFTSKKWINMHYGCCTEIFRGLALVIWYFQILQQFPPFLHL